MLNKEGFVGLATELRSHEKRVVEIDPWEPFGVLGLDWTVMRNVHRSSRSMPWLSVTVLLTDWTKSDRGTLIGWAECFGSPGSIQRAVRKVRHQAMSAGINPRVLDAAWEEGRSSKWR